MTEADISPDLPNEAIVMVPKVFTVHGELCPSRSRVNPYKDISIDRLLNKAKFSVYLASIKSRNVNFALKMFPLEDKQSKTYFENEVRFRSLRHRNVIKTLHVEKDKTYFFNEDERKIAYILMEFAPNGDFFDFVSENKKQLNDKLIRTYFRQLVEGVSYLHDNDVAHLDLKLENLLLGEDYVLKIVDFDLSCFASDFEVTTAGTQNFRAPELLREDCHNPFAADIYSMGIILFVLKSGGLVPHCEDKAFRGIDLRELLNSDSPDFWKIHSELKEEDDSYFSADFRDLFRGMTQEDPEKRWNLPRIKRSKWYNGPIYEGEELKRLFETSTLKVQRL